MNLCFLGCMDVNECADSACHPDADCTNTPGSFTCACKQGYKGNGLLCMSKFYKKNLENIL